MVGVLHRLILVLTTLLLLSISFSIYADEAQDYLDQSQSFYDQEEYQKAIDALENALKLQPDWALAYYKLGQSYLQLGKISQAIQSFQHSTQLEPENDIFHANLAIAYLINGDQESAKKEYYILKTLNPEIAREIAKKIFSEPPEEPILRINTDMHTASINSVTIDREWSRFVVTASDDKTIRVWESETGRLLKIIRPPIGDGIDGEITAVAISPEGETIACGSIAGVWEETEVITVFNRESGSLLGTITGLPASVTRVQYSPDGKYLAALGAAGSGLCIYNTEDYSLTSKDPDYGEEDALGLDWNGNNQIVTASLDGTLRLYQIYENGVITLEKKLHLSGSNRPHSVAFSPDGNQVAVGFFDSPRVDVYAVPDLVYLFSPDCSQIDNGNLPLVAWTRSEESIYLYAGGSFHLQDQVSIVRWSDAGRGSAAAIPVTKNTLMALTSVDFSGLVYASNDPAWGSLDSSGRPKIHYPSPLLDFRAAIEHFSLSPDGATVEILPFQAPQAFRFSMLERHFLDTGQPMTNSHTPLTQLPDLTVTGWQNEYSPHINGKPVLLKPQERCRSLAISPDGQGVVLGTEWYLRCLDRKGQEKWHFRTPGACWGVNISDDGLKVVAAYGDGTIHWYRLRDGRELLGAFLLPAQNQWVAWTPQGYFDASEGADEFIGWHLNQGKNRAAEFYPAARFFEEFYRPYLIQQIMEKTMTDQEIIEEEKIHPPVQIESIKKPPLVHILSPQDGQTLDEDTATVTFEVTDQGGGIEEILIYHNGKLFTRITENLNQEKVTQTLNLNLLSGDNQIKVKALNREHTESHPAEIIVHCNEKRLLPKLYVLAVGINEYDDPQVNDLYAPQYDAEKFVATLMTQQGLLYQEVIPTLLVNQDTTRARVVEAMNTIISQAQEQDVVIFFWGGHGSARQEGWDPPLFYALPADVYVAPRDVPQLEQDMVTSNLISEFFYRVKARKQVTILDTCHSGAAVDIYQRGLLGQEQAVRDLYRNVGVVVLASSSATESAYESPLLGAGYFSFSLLYALSGDTMLDSDQKLASKLSGFTSNADYNRDGNITVNEVSQFLKEKVPTFGYQTPQVFTQGLDFPLFTTNKDMLPSDETSHLIFTPPAGVQFLQDVQYGTLYSTPNNGELYMLDYPPEVNIQNQIDQIVAGHPFQWEVSVKAEDCEAKVKAYSYNQNQKNYALLAATYPGTGVLLLIVVPADEYQTAQSWILQAIAGVKMK
ncbi:MAG: tetratricopeptide repeat protein [Candidatus Atribacteria bacterium]|nr:tetratricopeptide repeat protein [Candidatus Atribacteria bacterium]